MSLGLLALAAHENPIAFVLDLPDRERIESRSARGVTGSQIETGVVPGTADAFAVDEALGEWAMIMAAMGVDREYLRSRAHQQHVVVADMAQQDCAREIGQPDPLREIRTGGLGLLISHGIPPRGR
jgi:hypothetical protein